MAENSRYIDKYRPQKLADLVGQPRAIEQLTGLVQSGKVLGNTFLVSGPYGTGKTTIGRILARIANCLEGGTEPCGKCHSCQLSIDSHPDIQEINAADSRGIDEIRELLAAARLRPRNKARVYIIDECHQLTGPAAQAFLKALEEPPKHTVFVLCTTDPYKLLATIRSRAQWVKLAEVPPRDVVRLLSRICKAESVSYPKEVLTYIAESAGGHARDSVNMLDGLVSAAGPSLTLEEAKERLPSLVDEIGSENPHALVPKYVHRLLDGTITPMVYLRKVESPEYLLGLVLKFLKELAIYYIEPKMVDNEALVGFAKSTTFKKKPTADSVTRLYEIHLDAQERVKTRSTDPLDALDLAILKSAQAIRG